MSYKKFIGSLLLIVCLLFTGSTAVATVWTDHYDASNGYSFAGEGISTIMFDDWGYTGPGGRTAKEFAPINGFGTLGQRQHVATLWPDRLTPDNRQNILHDITNTPVYTNANMDAQVNFYYWGYTSPGFDLQSDYTAYKAGDYSASTHKGSLFNNMLIDLDGDYLVSKNDMHFKYYDVFSYVDATGANPSQEVVTTLSFQPYPVSDAIGWCGSVLASHPAALEVMAGQLTFDFAFDVYNGPNHIFMGTQVVPRFEMRSYGTLTINVWAGSDLQTFSSNAVVNNTNPNNQDRWDVDPNYYSRVSFHGGGVLPDGVWVSADSFNPDGSRKLNPDGTWNVTVVPAGTPGATWHDNAFAGYAFILRADGLRMLDWFNESVYGPDPCTNKNCDDGNPCTIDSCVGGVCVHTSKNCDDNNVCTTDTCNTTTGNCVHTNRKGSCDDGNACTLQDTCINGQCIGTAIPGCDAGGVDTSKNNFTMVAPDGTLSGGTNDVRFTWDRTKKTSVATSGQTYNATISSSCAFDGFTWKAHDVAIYGPGTYTVNPCCPAGSPGCALTCFASDGVTPISPITFTVGAGEIGGHMLFNWSINTNIDVVNVWSPNTVFAPSPLFDGTSPGGCGSNPATKVWDLMSKDWGSCGNIYVDPDTQNNACSAVANGVTDDMNGAPMIDGPFNGQNVNFNLMVTVVDLCDGVICNDNNPCTTDTCDPAIGCVYTPIPSCDPCFDAATRCNDSNICTTDTCDPVSGACIHTNNALSCDDGNACTTGDVCSNGNCAGTPVPGCGGGGVDTIYNNFTMIDALGALAGGANDVHFTWDGTKKTSVAVSGQVSNATLSSPCPFSGIQWTAHDVAIYGPGTYTVNPCCPAGSPGCSDTCNDPNTGYPILPITFIVGEGELGAHMLFNWGVTKNIDVVDIWSPKVAFGPSPLLTGTCGSNPANKVWDWMSKDWNGDGFNGSPMVDGPFQGFSANFNVMGVPSPSSCVPPAGNCDDNNPCTADSVDTNSNPGGICACINTPVADGTSCNDGNACTTVDVCINGTCTGTQVECLVPPDQCHMAGVCSPSIGACVYPPAPNGTQCEDGNLCTLYDTCQNGICTPGTMQIACPPDQCHVAGTCNTSTGVCNNPPAPNGTPCSDGNACTVSDYCQNGVCTGVPTVCAPADQCHLPGVCNTATGICSNPPAPNQPCCVGGVPVVCAPLDQCHVAGVCNTATGACSNPIKTNGTACNDNNTCTINDVCINGICGGTLCPPQDVCGLPGSCDTATGMCRYPPPIVCTALDQCHVAGVCNTATGTCTNPPAPNGTTCSDGNACTTNDVCTNGVCGGTPVVCTASDQCHVAGVCDTATGQCSNPIKANGTTCNDGIACTINDVCTNGVCSGTPYCPAPDQCHLQGICDTATGMCIYPKTADQTPCSDGNACTINDVCINGVCAGTPKVCTALDQCHVAGVCDISTGACSNPIKPNNTACNDGNSCTTNDVCTNGTCAGTPIICAAPAACKAAGVCDPTSGTCTYANLADGTACTDGLFCDGTDSCSNGTCSVHSGNPCPTGTTCDETTDTCIPIITTCNATNVGAACDDNNVCTTNDKCIQVGNKNHPTFTCQGTALSCDDNNACTNDSCNPATGCVHTPVVCDDNNICTIDSCDPAIGCVHKLKCDDGNICTQDICNPSTGECTNVPRPTSVTMKGSLSSTYELADPIYNDEIQATFTVTNGGCIMYTSGLSMVKVSPGSKITITCSGTGPAPNYATLDGNPITIPDNYTCADLDTTHNIHVTNMGKQGKGPGHDIDDYQLRASTNADSW